jgi:hypothetical protein
MTGCLSAYAATAARSARVRLRLHVHLGREGPHPRGASRLQRLSQALRLARGSAEDARPGIRHAHPHAPSALHHGHHEAASPSSSGCCAPVSIPTSSQSRDRCCSRCRRRTLTRPQNSSCMYQPIPSHVMQKPVIAIFLVRGRKSPHSNQGTSKRLCKANRT